MDSMNIKINKNIVIILILISLNGCKNQNNKNDSKIYNYLIDSVLFYSNYSYDYFIYEKIDKNFKSDSIKYLLNEYDVNLVEKSKINKNIYIKNYLSNKLIDKISNKLPNIDNVLYIFSPIYYSSINTNCIVNVSIIINSNNNYYWTYIGFVIDNKDVIKIVSVFINNIELTSINQWEEKIIFCPYACSFYLDMTKLNFY